MGTDLVKFSSQMDRQVLAELRDYARQSNRRIADILTEAVTAHLQQMRVRPAFRDAAETIVSENQELLSRLAR